MEDDSIKVEIKEKPLIQWNDQVEVKFDLPANYDDAQTPDTETSPVIDPAEVPCLTAQWKKMSNPTDRCHFQDNDESESGINSDVTNVNSITASTNSAAPTLAADEKKEGDPLGSTVDGKQTEFLQNTDSNSSALEKIKENSENQVVSLSLDASTNYEKTGKLLKEDRKNVVNLISNLQNLAETLSDLLGPNQTNKHLNFRLNDDDWNPTKELILSEALKPKKELKLPNKAEEKLPDELCLLLRNKNRPDSPNRDSLFFENERLLESKVNGNIFSKWSDANSVTSPCSTSESPFESGKRYQNQNIIFPKRSVLKNGQCNVLKKSNNSKRRIRYLQDIFTTLVDVQWRWTLLVFALSFIMSWLLYAGLYWLIAYAHGDFEHLEDEKWTPCVENLNNFASCFLFSVETQHTIGYGGRATTEECPEAIVVMCIQSITGVMISAFMAGIFFAKMSRPKHRRQTLLFSRRAVICQRDAQLCFMFRVGDMRKSHIIGTNISAHIFRTRTTREGEELHQYQCKLQVSADGCDDNIFFIWPLTMVHVINKDSPLYSMSAQDLLHEEFEVVAILEGTVESTGQTTQARTSYLATEIKWGHRFESVLSYNFDRQCYEIDYKKFNNTVKVSTPLCSAKDLDELYMFQSELCEYNILTSEPDPDNQ